MFNHNNNLYSDKVLSRMIEYIPKCKRPEFVYEINWLYSKYVQNQLPEICYKYV